MSAPYGCAPSIRLHCLVVRGLLAWGQKLSSPPGCQSLHSPLGFHADGKIPSSFSFLNERPTQWALLTHYPSTAGLTSHLEVPSPSSIKKEARDNQSGIILVPHLQASHPDVTATASSHLSHSGRSGRLHS